jgi:hypothetical protein
MAGSSGSLGLGGEPQLEAEVPPLETSANWGDPQ